jgi:intracellular multiplication protein IcmW
MPDMSHEGAHQFWKSYPDPSIYRVIAFMEAVEQWTCDGDSGLESAMQRLSSQLDELGNYEVGKESDFIFLACHIKMARVLRLMQSLDTSHPGAASKLLIHAEENARSADDPDGLFLRRNVVFERLRLLSRVFAPQRFALVTRALEGEDG